MGGKEKQGTVNSGDKIINLEKEARALIRRIYKKNLEGVKQVLTKLNGEQQEQVLKMKMGKVRIGKGTDTISVGERVLCYALEVGTYEICKFILKETKNKSLFSNKEVDGYTPIHCAAINSSPEIFQLLIDKKIVEDYDIKSKLGNTPLHFACKYKRLETVQLLLQPGRAKYDIKNNTKALPIHWAASGGSVEILQEIFKKYEEKDLETHKPEIENEIEIVKKKWEKENKTFKGEKEVEIRDEAKKRVQLRLRKNFGEGCLSIPDVKGSTPVFFAAQNVTYSVDEKGNEDPHFECVEWIFNHQMESDATYRDEECDTVLHFVSRKANSQQLAKILKANALLGAKNEVGNMPLDWISEETLHETLDNHLQKIDLESKKGDVSTKDQYEILFTNLFGHHASGSDIQNILALANSPHHQELALHPVCQSILSAKWQKMNKYFFIKLLFFIPFVILLSVYPILQNDLEHSTNKTKTSLENEIRLTWYALYFLLIIQVVFGILSVAVLITPFWKETKTYLLHFNQKRALRLLEYYWTQLVWSDWYEYILWIFAFLLLHNSISPVPVVLVAWFAMFLVGSNHPSILPFRYILVKILFRYIKFLIFAFGLISGFAMGFFLLMQKCLGQDGEPCVNGAFQSLYTTALKVPAMMMGEISFEAFSLDHAFPHVYFLFGGFIFLITCCLFNMMNGLAINITQEMMTKAHIFKTIAQCDMVYEFEVLLKEVSSWIQWFGFREINVLSPLWVERLKASPSSGKCKNLDEIGDRQDIETEDLWETNKRDKAKWYWVDRGYELDRKIIYKANAIISDAENAGEKSHMSTEIISLLEDLAKKQKQKRNVIYQDPADEETSDDEEEIVPELPTVSVTPPQDQALLVIHQSETDAAPSDDEGDEEMIPLTK